MATEDITTDADNARQKNQSGLRAIRTFEGDIVEYTKSGNISLIDIAAQEAKLRGAVFEEETGRGAPLKKILIIAFAVIALGAAGYWTVSKNFPSWENGGGIAFKKEPGPVLAEEETEILFDGGSQKEFLEELKDVLQDSPDPGKLGQILIIKTDSRSEIPVKRKEFSGLAGIKFPKELSDYLEDNFMLLRLDGSPILILKAKSYSYAFSQMLKWEKNMSGDLSGIFETSPSADSAGAFADYYIQNHDARIIYDSSGDFLLGYSFIDRKYLVIADSEESLAEMFKRFSSAQYLNSAAAW